VFCSSGTGLADSVPDGTSSHASGAQAGAGRAASAVASLLSKFVNCLVVTWGNQNISWQKFSGHLHASRTIQLQQKTAGSSAGYRGLASGSIPITRSTLSVFRAHASAYASLVEVPGPFPFNVRPHRPSFHTRQMSFEATDTVLALSGKP
jgi:hypothetical protein